MSSSLGEVGILRRELRHVWDIVNVTMNAWGEQAAVFIGEIKRLAAELAEIKTYCEQLESEIKDLKRRLAIHENYNNPSRDTITAKKRKVHQQKLREQGKTDSAITVEAEGSSVTVEKRRRGGQPSKKEEGEKRPSNRLKPDRSLDEWYAPESCAGCGRTDIIHLSISYKTMLEMYECGGLFCYLEISVPALCLQCLVITYPETPSIPGTACGPILREKIMNIHSELPPVRRICRLLRKNHKVEISKGMVSKCLSAISRHAASGCLWEYAPRELVVAAGAQYQTVPGCMDAKMMSAHSEPPVASFAQQQKSIDPPAREGDCSPEPETLPVPYVASNTRPQHDTVPSLISQVTEMLGMAPYVIEDESIVRVAGKKEVALVVLCPDIGAIIRITENKSKDTMRYMFQELTNRPLQADMYLAGNSFEGDVQTCRVHVWRKGESLAVLHGIDSPEQTYSAVHLEAYMSAKRLAERITKYVGGPLTSICEVSGIIRRVPGLKKEIMLQTQSLNTEMCKLIDAYGCGEVSDTESRKYATALENALPHMFTFLLHPGMQGHTNDIERLIKGHVVLPRKTQVALPDWTAAKTQANLQTIHANAAIWGVYSGTIVSANRGQWKPPPTTTDMLMSPPPQRPWLRAMYERAARASDPGIQAYAAVATAARALSGHLLKVAAA